MLPFPPPKFGFFWGIRVASDVLILLVCFAAAGIQYSEERFDLVLHYEFSYIVFALVILLDLIIAIGLVTSEEGVFEFETEDVNEDRAIENMLQTKAYDDIQECIEYGILSWKSKPLVCFTFHFL